MKRALTLAAVAAAALIAVVPQASATAGSAPQGPAAVVPADAVLNGDTSWGGACETPHCEPWQ
ncbi:hypothetical protein [Kitasatospora sp. NPDC004531]